MLINCVENGERSQMKLKNNQAGDFLDRRHGTLGCSSS